MTRSKYASVESWMKSVSTSKGSFLNNDVLIAVPLPATTMMWPSGTDCITTCAEAIMPAPGRFSTTTCWPTFSDIFCAMMRAVMSATPPGANGRMKRIGLVGKACAEAPLLNTAARHSAPNATVFNSRLMRFAPPECFGARTLLCFRAGNLHDERGALVVRPHQLLERFRRHRRGLDAKLREPLDDRRRRQDLAHLRIDALHELPVGVRRS